MIVVSILVGIGACVAAIFFGFLIYSLSNNPLTPWDKAVSQFRKNRRVPVVVSLTTMPSRLQGTTIKNVLASVMAQDPAPQAIELNIPYEMKRLGTKYTVPQWLIDSPIDIYRCDDLGPATKYASTLERYATKNPDQKVLVMDDDMIMPLGLLEAANTSMDAHPDSAICGHGMVLKDKGSPKVKFSLIRFVTGQKTLLRRISLHKQQIEGRDDVQEVDIVTGYQGYGVRPRFFEMSVLLDYSDLPPEAVFVDDMVISGRLAQRGVPRLVSGAWRPFALENSIQVILFIGVWLKNLFKPDPGSETLSSGVNRSNHNNDVVVRHFWQVW
jgi:hypothetical protein